MFDKNIDPNGWLWETAGFGGEQLASRMLVAILTRSASLQAVFLDLLDLPRCEGAYIRNERRTKDGSGRVDILISGGVPQQSIAVEVKLWAPLGQDQIATYARDGHSVILLAPKDYRYGASPSLARFVAWETVLEKLLDAAQDATLRTLVLGFEHFYRCSMHPLDRERNDILDHLADIGKDNSDGADYRKKLVDALASAAWLGSQQARSESSDWIGRYVTDLTSGQPTIWWGCIRGRVWGIHDMPDRDWHFVVSLRPSERNGDSPDDAPTTTGFRLRALSKGVINFQDTGEATYICDAESCLLDRAVLLAFREFVDKVLGWQGRQFDPVVGALRQR
jgi:hypothetical protein